MADMAGDAGELIGHRAARRLDDAGELIGQIPRERGVDVVKCRADEAGIGRPAEEFGMGCGVHDPVLLPVKGERIRLGAPFGFDLLESADADIGDCGAGGQEDNRRGPVDRAGKRPIILQMEQIGRVDAAIEPVDGAHEAAARVGEVAVHFGVETPDLGRHGGIGGVVGEVIDAAGIVRAEGCQRLGQKIEPPATRDADGDLRRDGKRLGHGWSWLHSQMTLRY